jgi:hypothetical protein
VHDVAFVAFVALVICGADQLPATEDWLGEVERGRQAMSFARRRAAVVLRLPRLGGSP